MVTFGSVTSTSGQQILTEFCCSSKPQGMTVAAGAVGLSRRDGQLSMVTHSDNTPGPLTPTTLFAVRLK